MKKPLQIISYVAVAIAAYFVISYLQGGPGHSEHDQQHGHGPEDHGAGEHGHAHGDERPTLVYTHFNEYSELFVEFPALVVGQESAFAAHFNDLVHFKPLVEGKVTVILSGGGNPAERFVVEGPTVPGIFRPVAVPKHSGKRNLIFELEQ